jgi:hypothetical protein
MAKRADLPGPVGLGIVVCESIAQDWRTNKVHLLGIGSKFALESFPGAAEFAVYAVMTSVREDCVAYFEVVDWEDDVAGRSDDLPLTKGTNVADDAVAATFLRNVLFPAPGDYFVRFIANRQLVMEKRIMVVAATREE